MCVLGNVSANISENQVCLHGLGENDSKISLFPKYSQFCKKDMKSQIKPPKYETFENLAWEFHYLELGIIIKS